MINNVYLRTKKMRSGNYYFYLQYYPELRLPRTNKFITWEPLRLRYYPKPRTSEERRENRINQEIADRIFEKRRMQLASDEFEFINPFRKEESAMEYFRKLADNKDRTVTNTKWQVAFKHFENFKQGKCLFGELDQTCCEMFRDYLLNTKDTRTGKKLHRNAASAYFNIFRCMLKYAYRDHWLIENLCDRVEPISTIKTHKQFLTLDEVRKLANTYCESDVLKRASLFSIFTGLRISDVMNLKWENIIRNQFGGYSIQLNTVKNGKLAENPLSMEALSFCGPRAVGTIFVGLTRDLLYDELPRWIAAAGIDKHITFHCFRHTYATLQIAAGTDIYTVSKMLTHSNVATTQIYADLVSEKKLETISRISLVGPGLNDIVDDQSVAETPKRKRGRPRKNSI